MALASAGRGTPGDDAPTEATTDDSDAITEPGFGELIEGTFLLSGAADEQYSSTDENLAFRMSGGCQDGAFGFEANVEDTAATATCATFGAQGQVDLSDGATGQFDDVDLEVTVFAVGDMSSSEQYEGPVKMIISEHDTGGVDADVTYRWVMGCP